MKLRLDIGRLLDSISGSRPLFFNNGVTTAYFITAGAVEDSIDMFTMRGTDVISTITCHRQEQILPSIPSTEY